MGFLERVYVEKRLYGRVSRAILPSGKIARVRNATKFSGIECLCNFHDEDRPGYFVSSDVPNDFERMRTEDFFLYALWTECLKKSRAVPALDEVKRYFDPGWLGKALYVNFHSGLGEGKYLLQHSTSFHRVVLHAFLDFAHADKGPRLVLTDNEKVLERIIHAIENKRVRPIEMERL